MILFLSTVLSCWLAEAQPSAEKRSLADPEQMIRVRLLTNASQVKIQGMSLDLVVQGKSVSGDSSKDVSQSLAGTLLSSSEKVILKNRVWNIGDEKIAAQDVKVFGDFIRVNGKQYIPNGSRLIRKKNGLFDIVAKMPLDDYLKVVLPSEMPVGWPMEALKAQAIASRSYTLSLLRERRHLHFDVEATIHDQVFDLINHIGAKPAIRNKVAQAVESTRGKVLKHAGNKIFRAFYHADSGGRTERAKYVWGNQGHNQPTDSVMSPFPLSPHGLWQASISRDYVEQKLRDHFDVNENVVKISPNKLTPSGRLKNLKVKFKDAEKYISSHDFRQIFGFRRIKSAHFKVVERKGRFWFEGRGYGHGVGMCQWGARHLAHRGLGFQEILKHYYPRVDLVASYN